MEAVSITYSLLAKFSVFLFSQDKILIEFGVLISGDSVYSIHLLMQEMLVRPLGRQDPQEKEIALGNSMDRGAWQATLHGVAKESDTT